MVVNRLVRRANVTSSFIFNEPGLMSLFVQPVQGFSLLLAAQEAVSLGALPRFVILVGQYFNRSLAFNSSSFSLYCHLNILVPHTKTIFH